jgi:ABC-type multidrug transport system fused ATPase/permease subunit
VVSIDLIVFVLILFLHQTPKDEKQNMAATKKERTSALVKEEGRERGRGGTATTLLRYLRSTGVYFKCAVFLSLCAYSLVGFTDIWLAQWLEAADTEEGLSRDDNMFHAVVYICMSVSQLFLIYSVSSCNAFACMTAGRRLHADAITNVMHARMSWFESTPSGRILSRFSGDFNNCDYNLQFALDDCTHFVPYICALLAVISFVIPELIVVVVCGGFLYGVQVIAVDKTNRESKRMANVALSPVLTTVAEAANGRLLINVMNLQEFCYRRNHIAVDEYNRHNFTTSTITNWGTLVAQGLSFFIAVFSASFVLLERNRFRPVYAALAVTYSFLLPHFLGNLSAVMSMMFGGITALERIYELQSPDFVPQELGDNTAEAVTTTLPAGNRSVKTC